MVAAGQHDQRRVLHRRMPHHARGVEEHGERPAAALRVSAHALLSPLKMRRRVRGLFVCALAIVSVMKDPLKALGDKVRELRTQLDLSQEAFAERCDFDRTYISLIERGQRNPSFTNLIRLAEGLEISVSALTNGI